MPNSDQKIGVKGKVLHSQARELIARVMKFMKEEAENGSVTIPLANYKARVLAATGISDRSYRSIQKETANISAGTSTAFTSPRKNIVRSKPKSELHEGELAVIRTIIHDYTTTEKQLLQ